MKNKGFATTLPQKGFSFHGVLHLMSNSDMKILDKIEGVDLRNYERNPAKAKLYDGKVIDCTVYTKPTVKVMSKKL